MRLLTFLAAICLATPLFAEEVDFTLPGLDGKPVSLSDYRGKWVLVNYWATWCPPCQEEIPELNDFHERHQDGDAVVIGINFEDIGKEQLASFVDSFMMSYPVLRSEPMAVTPLGTVPGLPTTFIIAPDGSTAGHDVGGGQRGGRRRRLHGESRSLRARRRLDKDGRAAGRD